jgi:hypothetical protein
VHDYSQSPVQHSGLFSIHYQRREVILAPLPAWGGTPFIINLRMKS